MKKKKTMLDTKCPYCGGAVLFKKNSSFIYNKDYGPVYHCEHYPKCDSFVGTHGGSKKSLGRLADRELREKKKKAHLYFDTIWREKVRRNPHSKKWARGAGYKWICDTLNIPPKQCHIGMMDDYDCNRVIELCKPYYEKIIKQRGIYSERFN